MNEFSGVGTPAGFGKAPAAKTDQNLIVDGSIETFERDVLMASMQVPVIVDFWATWCGPCKQLTPALEKAVTAAGGKVRLVKIDIDKNQMLATQLRIQSVPTVFAFFQGQPIDGFMGAVPGSELKAFIERIIAAADGTPGGLPDEAGNEGLDIEQLETTAMEAFNQGDVATAAQIFAQLVQYDPANVTALAGLARCYVAMGEFDQARSILASAPEAKKNDPAIRSVYAAIELADTEAGDVAGLKNAVAANPADLQARFDLATALISTGDMANSIDQLLEIIEKDRTWNEEAPRKKLLTLFEAMGPLDPLVKSGRRRMSSILFS